MLMVFLCVAIWNYSVSLIRFPFLSHIQVYYLKISLVCQLKYPYSCFTSYCCVLVIVVLFILVLFVLVLVILISLALLFLNSLQVVILMHPCNRQCLPVFFLLLFLTHTAFLCHLSDVSPYASLWVFVFSGSFLEFYRSSDIRRDPSILQRWQPRC